MEWRIAQIGTNETVAFAASELKRCLERMDPATDVAILVTDTAREDWTRCLWVGMSDRFHTRLPGVQNSDLDDAILIEVLDGSGIVTGSNERSVLIAAYRLLRELGCRWSRPGPGGEKIPARSLAQISVRIAEKASYRHRGVCIEGASSYDHVRNMIDWLPKVGMNAYFMQFLVPYTFYDKWYSHKGNPTLPPQPVSVDEVAAMMRHHVADIRKRGMLYHAVGHGWTCEPFGIEGNSWDVKELAVPEETKQHFALVSGQRELFRGIPLDTNLCYSDPKVRCRMASAVRDYCKDHREVHYVHVWLADGMNNHCECSRCRDTLPSDYYVQLLNEIDRMLAQEGLETRVVFLLYMDLLWWPLANRLQNPDRFVMMFAPITRTYSTPYTQGLEDKPGQTRPYVRNRLTMPKDVKENMAYLKRWQAEFTGDSFDFDYHLYRDHTLDIGGYRMAQVLFEDMKDLHKLGLNGMMSCQVQRAFFPTGLAMTAMAGALWNREQDFDTLAGEYFADLFGPIATEMTTYFRTLSELLDPPYLRIEKPVVSEESARRFASLPDFIRDWQPVIQSHLDAAEEASERVLWSALRFHAELCIRLAASLEAKALGNKEETIARWAEVTAYVNRHEREFHEVFDANYFLTVAGRSIANTARPDIL